MIHLNQINYLIFDVIQIQRDIPIEYNVKNNEIYIGVNDCFYIETLFYFSSPTLTQNDLRVLDILIKGLTKQQSLQTIFNTLQNYKINILKLIHFFVNEFYLENKIELDKHSRIGACNVKQEYTEYLEYPIVDILIYIFLKKIRMEHILKTKEIFFTCDYDILDYHDHIGFKSTIKRFLNFLKNFTFCPIIFELRSILLGWKYYQLNPFLNETMFYTDNEKINNYNIYNIAFLLVSAKNIEFDINNNYRPAAIKKFLQNLSNKGIRFGIHPNYNTIEKAETLMNQNAIFEDITKHKPSDSRLHYLRFTTNSDFNTLENSSIKRDFSYAFADSYLFRGARSCAVKFWDFKKNKTIDVLSYPLTLMDGIFSDYLKVNYETALSISLKKITFALNYGNSCVLLWHNRSMYKYGLPNNYHPKLFREIKKYILKIV